MLPLNILNKNNMNHLSSKLVMTVIQDKRQAITYAYEYRHSVSIKLLLLTNRLGSTWSYSPGAT